MRKTLVVAAIVTVSSLWAPSAVAQDKKAELQTKLEATDQTDANAMFELALWAEGAGLKTDSRRLLRKVIKLDKNHAEARKSLGYVQFDGRWVTKREMDRLKRKAEEENMRAKGLRKYKNEWIPEEDYEKYQQGLVPMELEGDIRWVTEIEKERILKGMVLHDGLWVTPEERDNLAKGLFKVGEEWVDKEKANEAHADILNAWQFEQDHVRLTTTCDYDFGKVCLIEGDAAVRRAYQLIGVPLPAELPKVDLMMLRDQEDYNQVGGNVGDALDAAMSSTYACFVTTDPNSGGLGGVAVYQVLEEGNKQGNDNFSKFLVRHVAAECAVRSIPWKEEVPPWFKLGIGTYCERYWDPFNSKGITGLGKWSVGAMDREGGALKFKSFFDSFAITRQTILQSGLVISYLTHGTLPEKVQKEWDAVKAAMNDEKHKGLEKAFIKLEVALTKYGEDDFEAYAASLRS